MPQRVSPHDPDAITSVFVDWGSKGNLVGIYGVVVSAEWIKEDGADIVIDSSSTDGYICEAVLSGGTVGETYYLTCRATFTSGNKEDATIEVPCEET